MSTWKHSIYYKCIICFTQAQTHRIITVFIFWYTKLKYCLPTMDMIYCLPGT